MTSEEQAVIEAAVNWENDKSSVSSAQLHYAVKALERSREPKTLTSELTEVLEAQRDAEIGSQEARRRIIAIVDRYAGRTDESQLRGLAEAVLLFPDITMTRSEALETVRNYLDRCVPAFRDFLMAVAETADFTTLQQPGNEWIRRLYATIENGVYEYE